MVGGMNNIQKNINFETRCNAIAEVFLQKGLLATYSLGNKSREDSEMFIKDTTLLLNENIPDHDNLREFDKYLNDLKKFIITNFSSDFMPNTSRLVKLLQQFNKTIDNQKYAGLGELFKYDKWELPKGTNIAQSGIIYDDDFKREWYDTFPNETPLACKSFVMPIHKGQRVFGDYRHIMKLIKMGLPVKHTIEEKDIQFEESRTY